MLSDERAFELQVESAGTDDSASGRLAQLERQAEGKARRLRQRLAELPRHLRPAAIEESWRITKQLTELSRMQERARGKPVAERVEEFERWLGRD